MKPTIRDIRKHDAFLRKKETALDKGLRPALLAVLAVGGLLLGAQPASAGTITDPPESDICLADLYTGGGSPNCTANDVRIAGVARNPDGTPIVSPTKCTAGSTFTLSATFQVATTATERFDIGIYFDIGGDPEDDGARTGRCSLSTLPTSPLPFRDLDGDFCGDTVKTAAASPLLFAAVIPNVSCTDSDGDGFLDLPNAVSWQQNDKSVCSDEKDAAAGAPSKCKVDDAFNVPVEVERVTLSVTKDASPTALDEPGGDVDYTVTVTNPATAVSVTLTTIVDDPDNDPDTINSTTYQAADICDVTLLGPGDSATCTFTRNISGVPGDTFTDEACVRGTDSNTPPNAVGPTCDTATVAINDVVSTATLEKTAEGGVCAIERYKVEVTNTSTVDSLDLSSLDDDKFGDITALSATVFGTTCGVSAGEGTLDGVTGAGTLPATIGTSSSYICQFDGLICEADFPHTDTVTGTLSDNDGNTLTPSDDATVNPVTVP